VISSTPKCTSGSSVYYQNTISILVVSGAATRAEIPHVQIPYVERFMHHDGGPQLKSTVVETFEKHINIRTDCMCIIYMKIRINTHMYGHMW
jgi:hypothetical protein